MDLETRREIRKNKILGNSENRLKKICSFDADVNVEEIIFSTNVHPQKELVQKTIEFERTAVGNGVFSDIRPETNESSNKNEIDTTPLIMSKQNLEDEIDQVVLKLKHDKTLLIRFLILLLLSCFVRFLFTVNSLFELTSSDFVADCHFNKIFLLFFVFELFEYTFLKPVLPQSKNLVLCLLQTSANSRIFHTMQIVLQLLQDLMVYFFGFVCLDQFINFMLEIELFNKI